MSRGRASTNIRDDYGFRFKLNLGTEHAMIDTIIHVLFSGSHIQGSPQVALTNPVDYVGRRLPPKEIVFSSALARRSCPSA